MCHVSLKLLGSVPDLPGKMIWPVVMKKVKEENTNAPLGPYRSSNLLQITVTLRTMYFPKICVIPLDRK